MKAVIRWTTGTLCVLAVPVLLVTSAVRWWVSDLRFYRWGFDRQGVERTTGIPLPDLMQIARELRRYLVTGREPLDVRWQGRPLFTEVEVIHMRDVKVLVQRVFRVQEGAGAYLLAYGVVGLLLRRRALLRRWARTVLWGSLLTWGLVFFSGLVFLTAFPWAFTLFHQLSFPNPFWQLDPSQHYLIRLFPEGFWFEAALGVATASAGGALLLAFGAGVLLKALPERKEKGWWEFFRYPPFP